MPNNTRLLQLFGKGFTVFNLWKVDFTTKKTHRRSDLNRVNYLRTYMSKKYFATSYARVC